VVEFTLTLRVPVVHCVELICVRLPHLVVRGISSSAKPLSPQPVMLLDEVAPLVTRFR